MARIEGRSSGLNFQDEMAKPPKAKPLKAKAEPRIDEKVCEGCGCTIRVLTETRRRPKTLWVEEERMCMHCCLYFGFFLMPGVTNATPSEAKRKMAELKEHGYLMVLRHLSVTAPDGAQISIAPGDIFTCNPGNPPVNHEGSPSKQHTWSLFTLDALVGPYTLRLFPHEWSPIPFATVMRLKRDGEITEAYMSADDKQGHFTPRADLAAEIDDQFGRLVNAPLLSSDTPTDL